MILCVLGMRKSERVCVCVYQLRMDEGRKDERGRGRSDWGASQNGSQHARGLQEISPAAQTRRDDTIRRGSDKFISKARARCGNSRQRPSPRVGTASILVRLGGGHASGSLGERRGATSAPMHRDLLACRIDAMVLLMMAGPSRLGREWQFWQSSRISGNVACRDEMTVSAMSAVSDEMTSRLTMHTISWQRRRISSLSSSSKLSSPSTSHLSDTNLCK